MGARSSGHGNCGQGDPRREVGVAGDPELCSAREPVLPQGGVEAADLVDTPTRINWRITFRANRLLWRARKAGAFHAPWGAAPPAWPCAALAKLWVWVERTMSATSKIVTKERSSHKDCGPCGEA